MTEDRTTDGQTLPVTVTVVTDPALAPTIAEVAAITFPLACPPNSDPANVSAFIEANLRSPNFVRHIDNPTSDVLVARRGDGPVIGYALVHHGEPADDDVRTAVTERPVSEVSKMYVLPDHHAYGRADPPSHALMSGALDAARGHGSVLAWLGVNEENERAQRFYVKMGFVRAGTKTFSLNGSIEHDLILVHRLTH
ncbi:GNAT family N-acetyltransferase [Gordonia soli]|uniref:N-acetyltransferase domain-containing protein n=1 Tax=Gordonia soli NBRC 108243 TaxID=1223545 RepID=M0QK16_9ACTN|nr:GNAT family N-acetyltransferase [Gordonia soli]GAC68873.1 hypothetical protein GS4_19_00630 [Gordonia soli NBRC 108243]